MTRVAIYARVSTDKQSEKSPDDQVAECRKYAAEQGWHVVEELVIVEAGVSGASRHNRPGLRTLLEERIVEWDVLLAWDSSRLARDDEDSGWVLNKARARKRRVFYASTRLDIENIGSRVMGVVDATTREKIARDTHRGLLGRAQDELATGALPYGFGSDPLLTGKHDFHGQPEVDGYRPRPDPETAPIVVRIFERFLAGASLRKLAHQLNAEGVRPPRPRALKGRPPSWTMSSLRALLGNPMYRGEVVWNRSQWVKDHDTGRRRRFERPESEWVRREDPTLALVTPETWERTQAELRRRGARFRGVSGPLPGFRSGRARHLLSGLLECATCGGGFFAVNDRGTYTCGWRRDRGPDVCASDLRVPRAALEERILGAVVEEVLRPEHVMYVVEQATARLRQRLAGQGDETAATEARLAEVGRELENLVRLAAKLGDLDAHARVLDELRAERATLEARLRAARPRRATLDGAQLRAAVAESVAALREAFVASPERARAAFLALLGGRRMRVGAHPERGFAVDGIFEWSLENRTARNPKELRAIRSDGSGGRI